MRYDASYGIIPLKKHEGSWYSLIIKREKGFWEFPKGHSEEGEQPLQAAKRELQEETGLTVVRLLMPDSLSINYHFFHEGQKILKTVSYFVAEVEGVLNFQEKEVKTGKWVLLTKASSCLSFATSKKLCHDLLNKLNLKTLE